MPPNISDFPDDILIHILSFLPVKDSFRTTLLSHRWVSLFYSLSSIRLYENSYTHFLQFLNAVILSPRLHKHTLKTFHLEFQDQSGSNNYSLGSNMDECVKALKRRSIENLSLSLLNTILPPRVFCCKTLVVLKLHNLLVAHDNFSVDLPLLKSLDLYDVNFYHMNKFMKLLSGSPKLEHLVTAYVAGVWERYPEKPLLYNLISADVSLYEVPLTALYNAQILTVFWVRHDDLPYQPIESYDKAFQNLIQLELNGGILDWTELLRILQNCPKLQAFSISMTLTTNNDWKYPYHVPECVSSHLKKCRIEIYGDAGDDDFQFAVYILKNARFLEDMTIHVERFLHQAQKTKALEDLTTCTRISPTCQLSLRCFSS
ncbi:putative FBD-associated F-box protein At3g50710 [Vicia villosa]|uniref:putative FBD-associated F-box protein At3g50710 n=1 Tax=Vicia villosa TaxID=3911 RepID=UPI00273AC101|nr:putative FBD-associated F-box protein At3g50710 [Vicia villosa]